VVGAIANPCPTTTPSNGNSWSHPGRGLASYYFHSFWKLEGQAQQEQMVQFMKNLSMMGAMLFIAANGSGPMSLDSWLKKRSAPAEKPALFAQAG